MKFFLLGLILSGAAAAADIGVNPLFTYGNLQRFDEVTNLTPGDSPEVDERGENGYQILSVGKAYLSGGAQGSTSIGTDFYTGLGLYPSVNAYSKWSGRVNSVSELENFSRALPITRERLLAMKTGDAAYWNALGGVAVSLSVGSGPISAGPKVILEGGFAVYVERKDASTYYAEVRRMRAGTFGVLAGTYIAYAELSRLVEKTSGLAFVIDASTEEGLDLLLGLVRRGRADRLQESDRVRYQVGDLSALKTLTSAKAVAGTPFVPVIELKRGSGMEIIHEERSDIWDNSSTVIRALSFRDRSVRLLRYQTYMQTAALAESTERNGVSELRAQLHWFRKGNRMSGRSLGKALTKLINQTGLTSLQVSVPQGGLGFAKVDFTATPSSALLKALAEKFELKSPKEIARKFQSYWNGPRAFAEIHALIQACGGSVILEVSGQKLKRFVNAQSYPEAACSP